MKIISYLKVRELLRSELGLIKRGRIWLFDSQYTTLSKEEFSEILSEVDYIKTLLNKYYPNFTEELFDCEDYAHVYSSFVKLVAASDLGTMPKYEKGIAFGEISVESSMISDPAVHTLNFLITDDEKAFYFEPQANKFVEGLSYKPLYARI